MYFFASRHWRGGSSTASPKTHASLGASADADCFTAPARSIGEGKGKGVGVQSRGTKTSAAVSGGTLVGGESSQTKNRVALSKHHHRHVSTFVECEPCSLEGAVDARGEPIDGGGAERGTGEHRGTSFLRRCGRTYDERRPYEQSQRSYWTPHRDERSVGRKASTLEVRGTAVAPSFTVDKRATY